MTVYHWTGEESDDMSDPRNWEQIPCPNCKGDTSYLSFGVFKCSMCNGKGTCPRSAVEKRDAKRSRTAFQTTLAGETVSDAYRFVKERYSPANIERIAATNPIVHCCLKAWRDGQMSYEKALGMMVEHLAAQNDTLLQSAQMAALRTPAMTIELNGLSGKPILQPELREVVYTDAYGAPPAHDNRCTPLRDTLDRLPLNAGFRRQILAACQPGAVELSPEALRLVREDILYPAGDTTEEKLEAIGIAPSTSNYAASMAELGKLKTPPAHVTSVQCGLDERIARLHEAGVTNNDIRANPSMLDGADTPHIIE